MASRAAPREWKDDEYIHSSNIRWNLANAKCFSSLCIKARAMGHTLTQITYNVCMYVCTKQSQTLELRSQQS